MLVSGFPNMVASYSLEVVCLEYSLINSPVKAAIFAEEGIPIKGVDLLLANDLAKVKWILTLC